METEAGSSSWGRWGSDTVPPVLPVLSDPSGSITTVNTDQSLGPNRVGQRLPQKSLSREVTTISLEDMLCGGPGSLTCQVSVPPSYTEEAFFTSH